MVSKYIKLTLIVYLAVISSYTFCQSDTGAAESVSQIITASEIELYGVSKLSDLLELIDEAYISEVDNYRKSASFTSSLNYQNWSVLLNGVEIDLKYFEFNHLNLLPISLSDIERVEIFTLPGLVYGQYLKEGAINIITKNENRIFSGEFSFNTGNEIGDPGPYRYTEFNSANVDQLGPYYSLRFSSKVDSFYLTGSAKYNIHTSTDPAIEFRNDKYSWMYKQSRQFSWYTSLTFRDEIQYHQLYLGKSRIGEPGLFADKGADMLYLNFLGKEIHSSNEVDIFGLRGGFSFTESLKLNYFGGFSKKGFRSFDTFSDTPFLNQEKLNGRISLEYNSSALESELGVDVRRQYFYSDLFTESKQNTFAIWNFSALVNFSKYFFGKIELSYSKINEGEDINYSATLGFYPFENNSLNISYSNIGENSYRNEDIYSLYERGYYFQETNLAETENTRGRERISFDVVWKNWGNFHNFYSHIFYNSSSNNSVNKFLYNLNEENEIYTEEISRSFADGSILGISFTLRNKAAKNLESDISYTYRQTLGEKNVLWDELLTIPNHKVKIGLKFQLAETFSIWARLKYISVTEWRNLIFSSSELDSFYTRRLEEKYLLDVGIQKYLLKQKILLQLRIKNLFSENTLSHPMGAQYDMNMSFTVKIKI